MKYYFLALATLVAVCIGCQSSGPQLGQRQYRSEPGIPLEDGNAYGCPPGQGPVMPASYQRRVGRPYIAPPAEMMARPGPMVDGPGPGVLNMLAAPPQRHFSTSVTQIRFVGPEGMQIGWQIRGGYAENQRTAPGRYNFAQGATYRLKLTNIPEREGTVLYPTLQIYPAHPETDAYLAHNSVPLQLTEEDLDQVASNNFVTKVIYLPSASHQELAIAGVETLVSTVLDPGVDPVAEADRRGTILAVLRLGNMDMETPDQAPGAGAPGAGVRPASYIQPVNGEQGQFVPPMPIDGAPSPGAGVPPTMMMGGPGGPGMPPYNPVMGQGGAPMWGQPMTGTPIGLVGPPHMPYGGPAGLKSYTVRNKSRNNMPQPVDHFLLDVKQKPGVSLPPPVRHVEYTETNPVYQ